MNAALNAVANRVIRRTRPFWLSPARLAVVYVVVFAISVGAIVGSMYVLTQRVLEREADSIINAELEGLKDDFRLGGLPRLIDALNLRDDSWGRTGAVYLLVDERLKAIAGNIRQWPLGSSVAPPWVQFTIADQARDDAADHLVRASITRIDPAHLLLVGTDVSDNLRFFQRFRAAMYWGIGLAVLLAALVGYIYVKRVAARVHSVAEACAGIMSGNLSRRLEVSNSRDEFDALAVIVNQMLDRLQYQAATLRTTFDSTAHDLRAPLYRVRMRVEQALREPQNAASAQAALAATLTEIDRIQSTLTTLLEIARADAGVENQARERVELGALTREVVELYVPEARARGLAFELADAGRDCTVQGSRQLFAQLLANLFENALKFVPPGGRVAVAVTRSGDTIALRVADNGPGIPAAERERVVRPFGRLERDRELPGSGLGLSLVAAIVGLYGGRLTLSDGAPGLSICCDFPVG